MDSEQILKIKNSIENLEQKKAKLLFFIHDTKGNAKASIRYIYDMALTLKRNGFNSQILHEKKDYVGVSSWLGEEYMTELPHQSIEGEKIEVTPEDFLIVPEIFAFMMEQVKSLPCAKIVLTQQYAHMLETLQPGQTWNQFGFLKCITTSEKQKEYINRIFRNISFDVVEPYISDKFQKKTLPSMPIIGVHTREQEDTVNLIKTFYLRFPQYRWFTFRDLRGLTEEQFADGLKECFVSVWIDRKSAYGTFPLESMKTGTPVIGIQPELVPEWMNENNGIWVKDEIILADLLADWAQNWLEDNISQEVYQNIQTTADSLQSRELYESKIVSLFESYLNNRALQMEEQISKFAE
jgi:hypothetical protein